MSSNLEHLISLLESGITGQGAKQLVEAIHNYKSDPEFCSLLANVFGADQCPTNQQLQGDWTQYRQQAGLALKNSVKALAQTGKGNNALGESANIAMRVLVGTQNHAMGETACQIVSKLSEVMGLEWWGNVNIQMENVIISQLLGANNEFQIQLGLRCLKYILEDAGEKLGQSAYDIITKVTDVIQNATSSQIRSHALQVLLHPYEVGRELNWLVDDKSNFQQALMRASPMVAYCSTTVFDKDTSTENVNKRNCLRIWLYLTDYFDYMIIRDGNNDQQDNQVIECIKFWVNTTVATISAAADAEMASISCDIIGSIANVASTVSLDDGSVIIPIADLVVKQFDVLLPALEPCMIMKEDMITLFIEKDNIEVRDEQPKKYKRKFTVEDNDMDAGETMTTLRDSAVDCLYNLSAMEPDRVYRGLIDDIQKYCRSDDWKFQEMAFTALGTIADTCCSQLDGVYAELVNNFAALIQSGSAHTLVTSMALWCLIKMSDWVLNKHKNLTMSLVNTACAAMPTNSKRTQAGATTLLKVICMKGSKQFLSSQNVMVPIINAIHTCLPVYHTNNLALLADAAQELWALLPDTPTLGKAVQPFIDRLQELSNRFYSTAQERYGNGDNNVQVNYDVIEVARAVGVAFMENIKHNPDTSNLAQENLQSWMSVVDTVLNSGWDISDDPALVGSPLHLCNLMAQGLMPEAYSQVSNKMVLTALKCFDVDSQEVKGECIQTCVDALTYMGLDGIPSIDEVVAKLVPILHVPENPQLSVEAAGLLRELFAKVGDANMMHQVPQSLVKATQMLAMQVRTDAHDSHMTHLSLHLAVMGYYNQGMYSPPSLHNIIVNVRSASNDNEDKAIATEGICQCMSHMATQQRDAMPKLTSSFIRLVFSWQYAADEGTRQACGNVLRGLNSLCPDAVAQEMGKKQDSQKWIQFWHCS